MTGQREQTGQQSGAPQTQLCVRQVAPSNLKISQLLLAQLWRNGATWRGRSCVESRVGTVFWVYSDANALLGVSGNSVMRRMAESAHGRQTAAFSMLLRGNHIQETDWLSETVPTAAEVTAGVTSATCHPSGQFNMCACFPFLRVPKQKE